MSTEAILVAVAIGILVPAILLIGPYLPYLRPVRDRLPDPDLNRFTEMLVAALADSIPDSSSKEQ